jgi:hypothetical protein
MTDPALARLSTHALFDELVARTLSDDDDGVGVARRALQQRDPGIVYALVAPLAAHEDARLRVLVPNVLRYLGEGTRPLLEQTVSLLSGMLRSEQDPDVLGAVALAFGELWVPAVDILRPLVTHPDASVRECVVHGLLAYAERAVPELIALSRDTSDYVRNWATFALGTQTGTPGESSHVDTKELRDALVARLGDPHSETRAEAALGLAIRGDTRAIPLIARELDEDTEWTHYAEAAEHLADPRLYESLLRASGRDPDSSAFAAALAACAPGPSSPDR